MKENIRKNKITYYQKHKEYIQQYQAKYYRANKQKMIETALKNYYATPLIKRWAQRTIHKHRSNGCVVTITTQQLVAIAAKQTTCQICGIPLKFHCEKVTVYNCVSLDRMNNEKEINENNILILCHKCNTKKGNQTFGEFYDYCKMVASKSFDFYEKS